MKQTRMTTVELRGGGGCEDAGEVCMGRERLGMAARGATGGGGARMGSRAGPSPPRDWVGVEKLGSGGWVGGWKGGRMARVSSLMGYWAAWANYCAEKWANSGTGGVYPNYPK